MNPPLTPPRRGAAPFGQFATRQTPLAEWYKSYQTFDLNCTSSPKAFSGGRGLPVHGEMAHARAPGVSLRHAARDRKHAGAYGAAFGEAPS